MKEKGTKPWAGRFSETTDALVEQFSASVGFDKRLYKQDIQGSRVHARMLARIGILDDRECEQLLQALDTVAAEIEAGSFPWDSSLEDVHMNIESRLVELAGDVGKRLHTGRSRNDQVATDLRLYLREAIDRIDPLLETLQRAMVDLAEQESGTVMPGFTHLQVAQAVTFGHHMLAWFEMIFRDRERLARCRKGVNLSPLGAAALAGSSFALDREFVARELQFEAPCDNSLDAVSDRDFAIEFCAFAAILFTHLSRIAEELVLWASAQFGFIELPDRFCTGSSMMPQKKNPDVPELVRGKSGRVFASLFALLTLMKGQPLAYNKDNQEDKEALFDTVDTVIDCVTVLANLLPHVRVNREQMLAAAQQGHATATDLADYLVQKKLPFRAAHETVGRIVRHAITGNRRLEQLDLQELQAFSPLVEPDVFDVLSPEGSVRSKNTYGGTAPAQVAMQVEQARLRLKAFKAD